MDYIKYAFFKVKKVFEKIVNIKNIIIKNEKNKKNKNRINNNNIIRIRMRYTTNIIIIKYLIMIDLFIQIFPYYKFNLIDYKSSYVMVKVKGSGNKYVFYHGICSPGSNIPDEVWINEVKQDNVKTRYDLVKEENNIKLVWYNSVSKAQCMFRSCNDITEIDFSNFDSSQVNNIVWMLEGTTSLITLNLANFSTEKITYYPNDMFSGCHNLKYINLKIINESDIKKYDFIINQVPNTNVTVCVNKNEKENIIIPYKDKKYYHINCLNDDNSKLEEINECKINNCLSCPPFDVNNDSCKNWISNFYKVENDPLNSDNHINYYFKPRGYYFDIKNSFYKQCYYSCEICSINGNSTNHNCIKCKVNFPFEININNYKNCYEQCNFKYFFDEENIYHCTQNSSCPNDYPDLKQGTNECIKSNKKIETIQIINIIYTTSEIKQTTNIIITNQEETHKIIETQKYVKMEDVKEKIQEIIQYEKNETKELTKEEEIEIYNEVVSNVETIFTSEEYNTSNLDSGEDEVIQTEKMTITLTTTKNQRGNITSDNMTLLDLGDCEDELRNYYHISENETIYMRKIDVKQEGMKIPKVDYSVYCKINGTKLAKLDLSVCVNSTISLSVPVELSESLDKFNSSSEYYNNKCNKAKSDKGTDILLKDRQKEYVENNKTICQDDCDLSYYNEYSQKAICNCRVTISTNKFEDMNINKSKLYDNFDDSSNKKQVSNLGITSCDVLGDTDNIISNTGFFLLLIILAIFVIIFIIFCTRGYNSLENKIDQVIHKKFKNKQPQKNSNNKNTNNKNNIHNNKKITKSNTKKNNKINNITKKDKKKQSKQIINNSKRKIINNNHIIRINSKKISSIFKKKINNNNKSNKPDTDYEYNWLSYKQAILYDKRSNSDYYCSLIKSKQLFIFTFCAFNDYNSGIVKKFIFFLSFALHYTVNALFFDEKNLHQIYEDEGKFNFGYQISFIIVSAITSTVVLRLMLQFLVLTDKDILEVKQESTKDLAIKMKKKKLKCMKIKFGLFFIINFILLGLFWYYLTCFNAIYENTQIYLIENTFISFGFSLFYPFIINILPTIFRMSAIHSSDKDQEYLYKVSQTIQVI